MIKRADISVQRNADGVTLYATVGGYLESRMYVGYTITEAKRMFIERFSTCGDHLVPVKDCGCRV